MLRNGDRSPLPVVTVAATQQQMWGATVASGFSQDGKPWIKAGQRRGRANRGYLSVENKSEVKRHAEEDPMENSASV
jgi:hypothetical protein